MSNLTLKKQVWDSLAITLQFVIISLQIPYYYLKIRYYYLTIRYYYLTNTLQIPYKYLLHQHHQSNYSVVLETLYQKKKQVEYRESRDATVFKEEPT